MGLSCRALPSSIAFSKGILVSFFSSAYWDASVQRVILPSPEPKYLFCLCKCFVCYSALFTLKNELVYIKGYWTRYALFSRESCRRNLHSKIELVVMLLLQPLITLCNVLLRVRSQDIRCLRSWFFIIVFILMYMCKKNYFFNSLKKKHLLWFLVNNN